MSGIPSNSDGDRMIERKNNIVSRAVTAFSNQTLQFTIISVVLGLLVGAVILAIAGFDPFRAYRIMLMGIFSKPGYVSYTIIKATPIILTGLSIAFAFRTGLFNIGAEGQFIVGAAVAALSGYFLTLPAFLHIPVVTGLAILAAALWGGLAGYLKARFGVHEVISTIMMNWIALYFSNFLVLMEGFNKPDSEASYGIRPSASIAVLGQWKRSAGGMAWLGDHPFWRDLLRTPVNCGFAFAVVLAVAVWFVLARTTLGFRLRAVGHNIHAAEYGGIDVRRSIVTSMAIAGGLAGAAGAWHVMGVSGNITVLAAMEGYGFDGIAVALMGNCTAVGSVLAGLLFGALKYGGPKIQPAMGAPSEIINIVIGTIVFFIAMPRLTGLILSFRRRKRRSYNGETK